MHIQEWQTFKHHAMAIEDIVRSNWMISCWNNRSDLRLLVDISVGFVSFGKHLCCECWVEVLICCDVIIFLHDKRQTIPLICIIRALFYSGNQATENHPKRSLPLLPYRALFWHFFPCPPPSPISTPLSFYLCLYISTALFIYVHFHIILLYSDS